MRLIDEHALVIAGKGTVIDGELYIKVDDLNKCLDNAEVVQPQGYDKDRLIEELERVFDKFSMMWNGCFGSAVQEVINRQPTSDVPDTNVGKMPQSYKDRLIEFIDDIKDNTMYEDEFDEYSPYEIIVIMDKLIDFINQQPTTDGWIPVSERLPKESDYYEVTVKFDEELPPFTSNVYYSVTDRGWSTYSPYVIAWREHLPQPYKEEK